MMSRDPDRIASSGLRPLDDDELDAVLEAAKDELDEQLSDTIDTPAVLARVRAGRVSAPTRLLARLPYARRVAPYATAFFLGIIGGTLASAYGSTSVILVPALAALALVGVVWAAAAHRQRRIARLWRSGPGREIEHLDTASLRQANTDIVADAGDGDRDSSFWAMLPEELRNELVAAGRFASYSTGTTLLREGEPEDEVMVILGGRVRLVVHDGTQYRQIVERGHGDLIGEHAIAPIRAGNATVLAVSDVRVLRIPADKFLNITKHDAHAVFALQGAIYRRLRASPTERTSYVRPLAIVLADIAGFARPDLNDEDRSVMVRALFEVTESAFTRAGVRWADCHVEDRGDGLIAVVPEPDTRNVPGAISSLLREVDVHNQAYPAGRLRLRVAVHRGPVTEDSHGVHGEAPLEAARLLDEPNLRSMFDQSGQDVDVVLTPTAFEDVFAPMPPGAPDPHEFRRITLDRPKDAAPHTAWVRVSRRRWTGYGDTSPSAAAWTVPPESHEPS